MKEKVKQNKKLISLFSISFYAILRFFVILLHYYQQNKNLFFQEITSYQLGARVTLTQELKCV